MNKKVFISMIVLILVFLGGLYMVKMCYPQEFVMFIENEKIVKIGVFIDSHKILYYLFGGLTAFITYWLFLCACKGAWYLNLKETGITLLTVVIIRALNFYVPNVATHVSISAFFLLPLILRFSLRTATIVYSVHGLAQILSLGIRNLPMYLSSKTFVSITLLSIDMYMWLLLFYILFNYKGE